MSRQQRIDLLLRLAEERDHDASRALAERQRAVRETDERLAQLIAYRDDYTRGLASGAGASHGAQVRDYLRFLSRLNMAINEHRGVLQEQTAACEMSRERRRETRTQVAILEKVGERMRAAVQGERERREQKAMDEVVVAYGPRTSGPGLFER